MKNSLIVLFILTGIFFIAPFFLQAHFMEDSAEAVKAEEVAALLPEMKLLPDSPFYFLKTIQEKIQSLFIFNIQRETKFQMKIADKRLAEIVGLIHRNKDPQVKKALQREGDVLSKIVDLMVKIKEKGAESKELLTEHEKLLDDHELVLFNMEDDVPEEAANSYHHILDVIDQSRDHMKYGPGHEIEQVPGQ